jgi:shikimate 5-dehydrogenase
MTILDLTASVRRTKFVREAMERGCAVVTPQLLWLDQITAQAKLLTGKDVPRKVFEEAVPWLGEESVEEEEV